MDSIKTTNLEINICVVGPIMTNCYIINKIGCNEAIIIDPGDSPKKIISTITELKLKPIAVFLTHGHFDHIHAVNDILSNYEIKLYANEDEEKLINDPELNCSTSFRRTCACDVDYLLRDNQVVDMAGLSFKVINTPGHTSGSCCYYFEEDKVLISGDTLFCNSVGRTDFPTGSEAQLRNSIENRLMRLEDDVVVYPGHGEATKIGYEREVLF